MFFANCCVIVLPPSTNSIALMSFTKALPIASIPEQLRVTSVGYNVVNHSGFRVSTLFHALGTQRMALKELLGFPPPSAAVAALRCGTCYLGMKQQVFFTVLLAGLHQCRTSGLLAGHFRSVWHLSSSFRDIRKAGWMFHHHGSVHSASYFSQGRSALPK